MQNKINVIILLVNNNGYLAIRNTQKEFLKGRYYGTHPKFNFSPKKYLRNFLILSEVQFSKFF